MTAHVRHSNLLEYLPAGNVLDALAVERGLDAVVLSPKIVSSLSVQALQKLSRKTNAEDARTLASWATDPEYLDELWDDETRVTVRRAIAHNPCISAGLRRKICATSGDMACIEGALANVPTDDVLALLTEVPQALSNRHTNYGAAIRRAAGALLTQPFDTWMDTCSAFNHGSDVLAYAIARADIDLQQLLSIAQHLEKAGPRDQVLRECVSAQLDLLGEEALLKAWQSLEWRELARLLIAVNPNAVPIEQALKLLSSEELVRAYIASGRPMRDEVIDVIARIANPHSLQHTSLTDSQACTLYAAAEADTQAGVRRLNWVWSCCTAKQKVSILSQFPDAIERHGRMRLADFSQLVEEGLDTTLESSWLLIEPYARPDWSLYPALRQALVDHGPVHTHLRVAPAVEELKTLMERALSEPEIAAYLAYLAPEIAAQSRLTANERAAILTSLAKARRASWPDWVTEDDLRRVQAADSEAYYRLVELAAQSAYGNLNGDASAVIVPRIGLDWTRVSDSRVWEQAAGYLQSQFGTDTELWTTASTLLDTWHGSMQELAAFAKSVH